MMHHRPGSMPTSEYWVVSYMKGPPEIVRVRPGSPDGVYVDFFGGESRLLESDFVKENVRFIGSLALT